MKNKKRILLYAVNALLLILIGVCLLRSSYYSNVLLSQQTAKYWAGDSKEPFSQVSCYLPVNKTVPLDTILSIRKSIDKKLVEAGVKPEEEGKSWTDCYSTSETLTVKGERDSSEVTAIGVGGEFFLFHPYELVSGSYINDDDLMKDRVVLDYELAWKLFGGTSLEGMAVSIGGTPYYVAGVVRRETDKFSKKTLTDEPAMFMSFSTLAAMKEGTGVSCYELAMPDPITNFSKTFAEESFKTQNGIIVENSTRYDFSSIFKMFKDFGNRSMIKNGVILPYWENAARVSEVYIARLYVYILLLALFPLICLIFLAVRLIKNLNVKLKRLGFKIWDAWDDRYARSAAWKERRAIRKEHSIPWKERLAQKRRSKILSHHFEKHRQKREIQEKDSEEQQDQIEKQTALDVESIVREIMNEIESSDSKS